MATISLYDVNGVLKQRVPLTDDNLFGTMGMMVRCHMRGGAIYEGFSSPFRAPAAALGESDYTRLYLWRWDNFDEERHCLVGPGDEKFKTSTIAIKIRDILGMQAILYSSPRWGGRLHNHFFIEPQLEEGVRGTIIPSPCGYIRVADASGKAIPFTIRKSAYYTEYELETSKGERKLVNTDTKYDVVIDTAELALQTEYRIYLRGTTLHYGDSNEHTECVSGSANGYSIAIGAYDPNDEDKMDQMEEYSELNGFLLKNLLVKPPVYNEDSFLRYDVEMLRDYSGFKFHLIDREDPNICFPVAWIKNEPGEEMYYEGAVEFWTT